MEKLNDNNEVIESKYYCSIEEICKDYNYLNRDTISRYINNKVNKEKRLHLKEYNLIKLQQPLQATKRVKIEY